MQMDNKLINPILTAALAFGLLALAPATYAAFSSMPMPPASTTPPTGSKTKTTTTTTATTQPRDSMLIKCYGVAKAGMNDCDPEGSNCVKSIIDNDPNFFLYMPSNLCARIAGGMLSPIDGGAVNPNTDISTDVKPSFGDSDADMSLDNGNLE